MYLPLHFHFMCDKRRTGRPSVTFLDNLLKDTEMDNVEELRTVEDRPNRKECVQVARRPGG